MTILACVLASLGPSDVRSIEVEPAVVRLDGSDARAQLIVTGRDATGAAVDLTHSEQVSYGTHDVAVARVDNVGRVRPVGNGSTAVTVAFGALGARVAVRVADANDLQPVDFAAEVVPTLTRLGCNGGGCHGKASGQNGFRLSLLGSDPAFDFEALTREGRGRRVFPAGPESSLVLRKPTAQMPHGGGKRLRIGSPEYHTIARWIARGAVDTPASDRSAAFTTVRVWPEQRRLAPGSTQQLRVTAARPDGTESDVTRLARFQSATPDLATVDEYGRVVALDAVGEAAVTAVFAGDVAVSRFTIPSRRPVAEWSTPAPRNLIDRHVFGRLRDLGVPPSPACDDAEFARRSSLDVCGELPASASVEVLERDQDPAKRVRWVERLLDRPGYADLFAMEWSALLRNQRTLGPPSKPGTFALHAWVRESLAVNRPYDRIVADLLTARGDPARDPAVVWYRRGTTAEEKADEVAQLFLGVRLQCARCHRHPSERWGPADYYGFASLFARVGRKPGNDPVTPRVFLLADGEARDATSGLAYPPRLPGERPLTDLGTHDDPRQKLAEWLRRPDNPYFARAVVNRYWKHFFGRGLVEPEDDLRASNPATNSDLLDALAAEFVTHGFDLKKLVLWIATSHAYERSSVPVVGNARDDRNFARFAPRRLPAEVLLDAVDTLTGVPRDFEGLPRGTRAVQLPDEGFDTPGRFLEVFGRPKRETVCGCERSADANLSQSLFLLNAGDVEGQVAHPEGRAARWAACSGRDADKVVELYRLALSRGPTVEEREVCLAHLARRRNEGRLRQGFEDLVWALINTKEFQFVQ